MEWSRSEFDHQDRMNKLSPMWEGPYKVIVIPYPNAYVLEDEYGKKFKNAFNPENFKQLYAYGVLPCCIA